MRGVLVYVDVVDALNSYFFYLFNTCLNLFICGATLSNNFPLDRLVQEAVNHIFDLTKTLLTCNFL